MIEKALAGGDRRDVRKLRHFDKNLTVAERIAHEVRSRSKVGDEVDEEELVKAAEPESPRRQQKLLSMASASKNFAPPKVIQLVFRLGTVRNLPATKALKAIGYAELHEQFSVAASTSGTVYKLMFLEIMEKYLTPHEQADSLRILECFTSSAHTDVDLALFLVGLQMLLECASPGDTLSYCFRLLDSTSAVPRYISRFEVQTLVTYADESALLEAQRQLLKIGKKPEDVDAMPQSDLIAQCGDKHFLLMRDAIYSIVHDNSLYDYCGRVALADFLKILEDRVAKREAAQTQKASKSRHRHQHHQHHQGGPSSSSTGRVTPAAGLSPSSAAAAAGGGDGSIAETPTTAGLNASPDDDPSASPSSKRAPADSPFVFGRAWQGGGALMHRVSSKKMIIAALTPGSVQQRRDAAGGNGKDRAHAVTPPPAANGP